jgi:predicted unusual protein kinase regulating ubiquinone biosynthesis (AarF/ABC1/UbiB family)
VEGKPITYFEDHPHALNKTIARIGAMTFFEMLFKYNFIHADCHGGNIIVKISPRKFTFKDFLLDCIYKGFRFIENLAVKFSGESEIAKELYL